MCQPKPGPRCTNHAKQKLRQTEENLKEAIKTEDKHKIHTAKAAFAIALNEFDSTPGGQKAIQEKINSIREEEGNDTFTTYDYEKRLEKAKEMRKNQLKLAKMAKNNTKPTLSYNWNEANAEQKLTCENGDEIQVFRDGGYFGNDYSKCAWRLRDKQPIAMVRFYTAREDQYGGKPVLCDIEVNPDFRGEKLGVETIKSLNSHFGQLHTSGSYSSSGFRSLADQLPLYPGSEVHVSRDTTHYAFVDWVEGDFAR